MKKDKATKIHPLARKVKDYLLELSIPELAEVTVSQVARDFNVSEAYLARIFDHPDLIPVGTYIKNYKLFEAMHMIIVGEVKTVKELADRLGYSNPHYFHTQLKKIVISFPDFRRACLEGKFRHNKEWQKLVGRRRKR